MFEGLTDLEDEKERAGKDIFCLKAVRVKSQDRKSVV